MLKERVSPRELVAAPARSFGFHRSATFASLLVGYAGYYLCRSNLSVATPVMAKDASLGLTVEDLGWVASLGTLLYALGKLATGSLADAKGGRFVFFLGLAGAVLASLVFGLGGGLAFFVACWGANLFCQSMGWGGLVNVMARWFPKSAYGTAMGAMSLSYQFGGVVALLFSGWLLELGLGWRALFFVPPLALAAIGLATSFFLRNRPEDVGHETPRDPDETSAGEEPETTYFSRLGLVLSDRMFLVTLGLSLALTFLRTCFANWTPTYFKHVGAGDAAAAFKSAVFPLLGCLGTFVAGWYSDRFLQGRRGPVMATFLAGTALSTLALGFLDPIALWLSTHASAWLGREHVALGLVGLTGFFLLGSYSLVGGVAALDFGGRRTAGTAAGLLDGVGYLGGTLAGVGFAKVFETRGWSVAFWLIAFLAAVAIAPCAVLWKVKPR